MACLATQGCATSTGTRALPDVERIAQREVEARRLPGLAVVILKGDDTVFARGYGGIANLIATAPVAPETVFQLGSIGKQFLAALVLAMSGDGTLSLDAPAAQYLEDFPLLPASIQMRHLLSHSSGIRELFLLPEAQDGFDNLSRTRADLLAAIRKAPVDFPAGSRWSYSNTNYTLLALIVERITGKPYEAVLAERFFRPLGLSSLRQCASIQTQPNEARGHEWRNNLNTLSRPENMEWIRGDGGLCGSAVDLARWTRLLSTGRVIAPDRYAMMIAPTRLSDGSEAEYGFGLSLVRPDTAQKIAHNGAMRGFSASAAYYPATETTVVVLVNRGDVRTEAIERALARRVIGEPEQNLTPRQVAEDERHRLTGTYDIGAFNVQVAERDGRLWFEMPQPGPTFQMRHIGGGRFVDDADPDASAVQFDDDARPAQGLRLLMGGMHWYGKRVIVRP